MDQASQRYSIISSHNGYNSLHEERTNFRSSLKPTKENTRLLQDKEILYFLCTLTQMNSD